MQFKFPTSFWIANSMELFERWAFYGFFMLFANYLTLSTDVGALGLSQTEKGIIMGVGTGILYFLPVITGALADRYGFRRILLISYTLYLTAFLLMPYCQTFLSVFINYIFLAFAAALFKPIITATVAHLTDEKSASIGFGIFYQVVNIGAFIGPLVALYFGETNYNNVFYISAGIISLNFILLLFFKDPVVRNNLENKPFVQELKLIFSNIFSALSNRRFLLFLFIISGFWTMYYQLFYTLPVFIEQWVDMESLFHWLSDFWPWLAAVIGDNGTIKAEYLTDMDALYIIIFQIFVSLLVRNARPIISMIGGIVVCSLGMGLTMVTQNPFFILIALLIFGLGEMASSPKINEYIGRIAPKKKVALYMGCSFLPVTLGNLFTGVLSGPVYERIADKNQMIIHELEQLNVPLVDLGKMSHSELLLMICDKLQLTEYELTSFLWDKYHPYQIAYIIAGIGVVTALFLWGFDRSVTKRS